MKNASRREISMKTGRKGKAANLVPLGLNAARPRLSPPPSMSKPGRLLFMEIAASVDRQHFSEADAPLLCSLVSTTLAVRAQARKLERDATPDVMRVWEKLVKLQVSLCTKLRITVQARVNPYTAGRRMADHKPNPLDAFLAEDDDDDDLDDANG
jgi:hypothetical protein